MSKDYTSIITTLADKVAKNFSSSLAHEDPKYDVAYLLFHAMGDIHTAVLELLNGNSRQFISLPVLCRTQIEIAGTFVHIFDNGGREKERAVAFLRDTAGFERALDNYFERRSDIPSESWKTWSTSTVRGRIALLGDKALNEYDFLSNYVHINPAAFDHKTYKLYEVVNNLSLIISQYWMMFIIVAMNEFIGFDDGLRAEVESSVKLMNQIANQIEQADLNQ